MKRLPLTMHISYLQIAPPQDDKDLRTYCGFFIQQAYDPDGRKKHREDSMRATRRLRYGICIEPGVGEKQQKKLPAEVKSCGKV